MLNPQEEEKKSEEEEDDVDDYFTEQDIPIMAGAPLTDRKSKIFGFFLVLTQKMELSILFPSVLLLTFFFLGKFQAFIAKVESVEEADTVLRQLLTNKKIANSTHNMVAYRIAKENKNTGERGFIEFRDDDGEGFVFFEFLCQVFVLFGHVLIMCLRWGGRQDVICFASQEGRKRNGCGC